MVARRFLVFFFTFLVCILVFLTGRIESHFHLFYIPILVIASAAFGVFEGLVWCLLVSLFYVLEVLWGMPMARMPQVIPQLVQVTASFFLSTLVTAFIIKKIRNRSIDREAYEKLAADLNAKALHLNELNEKSQATSFLDLDALTDVRKQVQNLTDLMDVASAVQGSVHQEEILDIIVDKSWNRFKAHTCQINILNHQLGFVEIAAHRGFTPRRLRHDANGTSLYISNCPVMTNGVSCIFYKESPVPVCPICRYEQIKSYMCAPLRIAGQILGVLHVTSLKENAFNQDDLHLLSSFAAEASLAVQRSQLFATIAGEKAKIETIIHSIPDPLAVFGPDSTLNLVNQAFYRYFAVEEREVLNSTLENVIAASPYQIELGWSGPEEFRIGTLKQGRRTITTCYIARPTHHHFIHAIFTPIIDSQGQIAGAVALFHDITEIQELLERLEEENARAEEANRLKSEFLANMSHELRTPLNSIIGYTHCLLDGLDGPINIEQAKDLSRIISSSDDLLHLINDVLDLSKIESGKIELMEEAIDIEVLIKEVITALAPLLENQRLQLIKDLGPNLPILNVDQFRLKQILANLLSNAIKFTQKGTITVRVQSDPVNNRIIFSVIDTGIGIEDKALKYIFDAFRQADGSVTRSFGGSGLGLSISRKLVELLGGSIWVESKIGQGSSFHFTIPLHKQQTGGG